MATRIAWKKLMLGAALAVVLVSSGSAWAEEESVPAEAADTSSTPAMPTIPVAADSTPAPEAVPAADPVVDSVVDSATDPAPEAVPAADSKAVAEVQRLMMPEKGESVHTLRDVLRQAYLGNPTLEAARAETRGVHEELPQARSNWLPDVTATADVTAMTLDGDAVTDAVDGTTSKEASVALSQPIYRGGRTLAETRLAQNTISAQHAAMRALEQEILKATAVAYLDVLRDRALLKLSRNNRDVVARQLKATKDRFRVGEVTRTDVSQSEARLSRAEAEQSAALAQLRSSEATFEELVGVAPDGLTWPGDVALALPASLEDATKQAQEANPSVMASRYMSRAAEDSIDDVFGELLPSVDFSASWTETRDPQPGGSDEESAGVVGLTATIPLYESGAVRSRVRQAKQTANQRFTEISAARRAARQDVVSAWESLSAARAEISAREAQVEAAAVARNGVHQEADVGSRTILDALDADQEFLDAQVSLVSARRNEMVAVFTLAAALGELSPQTLGFPEDAIDLTSHLREVESDFFSLGGKLSSQGGGR